MKRRQMARKSRQAVRNGGWPAWLLVLIGIVIGAIGMGIVSHTGHMPISRPDSQPAAQANNTDSGPGIAANPQPTKPKYDFYSVLPEKDVVIPDAQLSAQAKAEQQAATTGASNSGTAGNSATQGTPAASTGSDNYLLQVGSFPSAGDAEALKAKLALKGFRAEVQPVTINGQTWNRVRLGPYHSASALEAVKDKLEAAGIHAIALKEH